MTGTDIKTIRLELGLEPFAFAQVLGVHPSTLYRWESTAGDLTIDPLQRGVLEQLQKTLRHKKAAQKQAIGQAALQGLLIGGTVVGLLWLLTKMVEDQPGMKPPEPKKEKEKTT